MSRIRDRKGKRGITIRAFREDAYYKRFSKSGLSHEEFFKAMRIAQVLSESYEVHAEEFENAFWPPLSD